MRGKRGYLKRRILPKIRERRFREIEVFGFRTLPTCVSTLQGVGNSSYSVYFPSLGWEKKGFSLKGLVGEEKLDFRVLLDVSSPSPWKGHVRLGEIEDRY